MLKGHLLVADTVIAKPCQGDRVRVVIQSLSDKDCEIEKGDRIGKLMFVLTRQDLRGQLFDNNPLRDAEDLNVRFADGAPDVLKEGTFGG